MKQILLMFCLAGALCSRSVAQNDSIRPVHRHELGADITAFLQQFLFSNTVSSSLPQYYFSYRYHLGRSNVRFGLGGNYSKQRSAPFMVDGKEETYFNTISQLSFRVGYEWFAELSPKWQAFYGLDIRPNLIQVNEEADHSNAGYIIGLRRSSQSYAFAPLLGFRYRLSSRVSILTEGSFAFIFQQGWNHTTFKSMDQNNYPALPPSNKVKENNIFVSFQQPMILVLAVDL